MIISMEPSTTEDLTNTLKNLQNFSADLEVKLQESVCLKNTAKDQLNYVCNKEKFLQENLDKDSGTLNLLLNKVGLLQRVIERQGGLNKSHKDKIDELDAQIQEEEKIKHQEMRLEFEEDLESLNESLKEMKLFYMKANLNTEINTLGDVIKQLLLKEQDLEEEVKNLSLKESQLTDTKQTISQEYIFLESSEAQITVAEKGERQSNSRNRSTHTRRTKTYRGVFQIDVHLRA
uniref:synaptonemal complex central element protein 1-like isoform X1 n=2 Tax=Myxine glutinosa TaxID=7769 RepID=UPI00358E4A61